MIRPATMDDIPALVALGARMHCESRYVTFPYDEDKCAALAVSLINAEFGVVLVAEESGQIVGWVAGGIGEQYFSYERMAFEYGVFIDAEHRGGTAGYRLVKAFIEWAKNHGARVINMGVTTGVHEERTGELYQRLGLARTGSLYSMEV
ncbi:GNAT family N-acetyltransferase [Yersinia aleksiciae]|uniref:GNAT family N-acetyltransferase n=1 Tax=Yersinia aleksiciae TaxID=263819 RepID=UPI001427B229|nr:GNAT family N-acetyltransferase [Yersinia aleksiciae]MDA5498007.1 GNAT family N-acetyltransferase [Yersinia aleksiciae]NIL00992.1 GNAT family N-acetyltransferase [Yersinia aleksiciae]WQC71624.1 GNAT family N-acetyltransferase [Yersinia aleksiciae]